jgi:molecular chaperone DnaJ
MGGQGEFGGIGLDLNGIFANFANRAKNYRQSRAKHPTRGGDVHCDISLTLEDIVQPRITKAFSFLRLDECPQCKSSGTKQGKSRNSCPSCKGNGIIEQETVMSGCRMIRTVVCATCQGEGDLAAEADRCDHCNGERYIRESFGNVLEIPVGIADGMSVCMQGHGDTGRNGGPRGDLYAHIHIEPHSIFRRQMTPPYTDLEIDAPITVSQAVLGCEMQVPTIYEGAISVAIPPGTQPGTVIKKEGYGVPSVYNKRKGDMLINVVVDIPLEPSTEAISLFQKLSDLEKVSGGLNEQSKKQIADLRRYIERTQNGVQEETVQQER